MNETTLVFGAGFMGEKIAKALPDTRLVRTRITKMQDIEDACKATTVKVIINCIGKTGAPNVDWCESNKPETYFSNVHVPYLLAEYCKQNSIKLVHISSGCIYSGTSGERGFTEKDIPNFTSSFYSFTKAASERILSAYPESLILRMRMPIDSNPGGRELIGKLLRYGNIINTPNSVTIVDDFIGALIFLLRNKATGIYNVCNPEPITHKEILDIYEEISGKKLEKIYIDADALVTEAPRSNCVLNVDKVQAIYKQRPTKEALRDVIAKYIANGG